MASTLNQILNKARAKRYAIGHFNAGSFEQIRAIVGASRKTKTPVMIGTSEGEMGYLGARNVVVLVNELKKSAGVPIFINADHMKSFKRAQEAVDAGYDSVHFDGSNLSYKDNVRLTRKVRDYAKKYNPNISVEGELGVLPTESSKIYRTKIQVDPKFFTDPSLAGDFVRKTKVDRLAVVFGTLHGIQKGGINPHIDIDRLIQIDKATGDRVYLVMHGGSGTPSADIKNAIKAGIVNVHINTEIRKEYVLELARQLKKNEYAPYHILEPVVEKLQKLIMAKITSFKN